MVTRPPRTVMVYDSGFAPSSSLSASRRSPARTSSFSPAYVSPSSCGDQPPLVGEARVAHHHPAGGLRLPPGAARRGVGADGGDGAGVVDRA